MDSNELYELTMKFSNRIWELVDSWKYFEKDTIGKQIVRSSDSVSANLKEGFGRFHERDKKRFFLIARGSLLETSSWIQKSKDRNLIRECDYSILMAQYQQIKTNLNKLIYASYYQTSN